MERITQIWVDLFCGAGGTTTGIESATFEGYKFAKVIACVNHDAMAINSHYENHPDTLHFTEDIRTLDLNALVDHLEAMKVLYPDAAVYLWASLECTNFSHAKGGLPRDADSRTLAEHLYRYIWALHPDFIYIENVREFMGWGPLDENGKPVSRYKGCDYEKWVNEIVTIGYAYDYRLLNSADFGAYTSRLRYFGQFAKREMADCISWPEPTHAKGGANNLKPYKAVKEVLDLSDVGSSIFNRKKPLVDNTLRRIYAGLEKFVSKDSEPFICSYYGGELGADRSRTLEEPLPTIVNRNIHSLVTPAFISKYYGNGDNVSSLEEPAGTITTVDRMALVHCHKGFLLNPGWGGNNHSAEKPAPTIIASQHKIPLSVVNCVEGEFKTDSDASDSEVMGNIKAFCRANGITDITMRMLKVSELKVIQGFPVDYKLLGSEADKKKFIGNSVCPIVAAALAIASEVATNKVEV